jgi:hypothetical protein
MTFYRTPIDDLRIQNLERLLEDLEVVEILVNSTEFRVQGRRVA